MLLLSSLYSYLIVIPLSCSNMERLSCIISVVLECVKGKMKIIIKL